MKRGLIQIYTGEGKGKTTAATGLIVRALGHGMKVMLVRFLKPEEPVSGEIRFLQGAENLTILSAGVGVFDRSTPMEVICASVRRTFAQALEQLSQRPFDLVVFDELNGALAGGCLPLKEVTTFLDQKPPTLEVVFTGRRAPEGLCDQADLISRIEADRHPFDKGVPARKGIEY